MAKRKTVQCAGRVGSFRKMPRDMARRIMLEDYDRAPAKGEALIEAMNLRLKGATMQEFLAERGA